MNGFSFNEKYNTFCSFGSDGVLTIWNKDTKSKYKSTKKLPAPITSSCFSDDGTLLAYAIGYDWIKGYEEQKNNNYPIQIFVRAPNVSTEVFKRRY